MNGLRRIGCLVGVMLLLCGSVALLAMGDGDNGKKRKLGDEHEKQRREQRQKVEAEKEAQVEEKPVSEAQEPTAMAEEKAEGEAQEVTETQVEKAEEPTQVTAPSEPMEEAADAARKAATEAEDDRRAAAKRSDEKDGRRADAKALEEAVKQDAKRKKALETAQKIVQERQQTKEQQQAWEAATAATAQSMAPAQSTSSIAKASQPVRGLDEDEDKPESKEAVKQEAKAEAKTAAKQPKLEELATITVKAADGSKAKVALAWLLQLHPIKKAFDDQHNTNAKDHKGEEKLCDYRNGADKVERVAGCPVCDEVAQAWVDGIATKEQLDLVVNALQMAYEQRTRMTPRDMANYCVLKLAHAELDAEALKKLWVLAAPRLCLYPLATAAALQLRVAEGLVLRSVRDDKTARKEARDKFIKDHNLGKPLVEQMAFEGAYAAGKAPDLNVVMLRAYGFIPMQVGNSVTEVFKAFLNAGKRAASVDFFLRHIRQMPPGALKNGFWQSAARYFARAHGQSILAGNDTSFIERYQALPAGRNPGSPRNVMLSVMDELALQTVRSRGFDKAVLEKMPEGFFKYFIRRAYFQERHAAIDDFPIEDVVRALQPGNAAVTLNGIFKDASWLADALIVHNEITPITSLELNDNEIEHLPAYFLRTCVNLIKFALVFSEINELPAYFLRTCVKLRDLSICDNNNLSVLPNDFLSTCTKLYRVMLNGNKLTALPDHFLRACTKLRALRLDGNDISVWPADFLFHNCVRLKKLALGTGSGVKNEGVTTLPETEIKILRTRGVAIFIGTGLFDLDDLDADDAYDDEE